MRVLLGLCCKYREDRGGGGGGGRLMYGFKVLRPRNQIII